MEQIQWQIQWQKLTTLNHYVMTDGAVNTITICKWCPSPNLTCWVALIPGLVVSRQMEG